MSPDTVYVDLSPDSSRATPPAADWRPCGKLINGRKTSAIITAAIGPESMTRRRRIRIRARGQRWWTRSDRRKAAESFDKSRNVTWSLWSWTINQPDGFVQSRAGCCRADTRLLLSSSDVSISSRLLPWPSLIWKTFTTRQQTFLPQVFDVVLEKRYGLSVTV